MPYERHDPETGCAWLGLGAIGASLVLGAILATMIFGFDWPVALAIIIVGALAVYWLLKQTAGR